MKRLLGTPALLGTLSLACSGRLDAGSDTLHGRLPVDERSAVVMVNDGAFDNWQGEYAALLAGTGQLRLAGIVVNSNSGYPDLVANVSGYRQMLSAARESGLRHLPDATASVDPPLTRPDSGVIEDTVPNRSEGARLILQAAAERATPVHPLAIATGGALTDIADAYLLDPTLAERAVVVASLGRVDGEDALTDFPNGGNDPWATSIVVSRMRYVQVNGYYDQKLDVPDERVAELPSNAFGEWMAQKRASLLDNVVACDQQSILAVALPYFAVDVARLQVDPSDSLRLTPEPNGSVWHVTHEDTERMRAEIWAHLKDPDTFRK